jgi:hypothetical protein
MVPKCPKYLEILLTVQPWFRGASLWRGFVSALQISHAEKKICQGRSKTQGTRAEVFHDVLLSHEMPIGTKEGDDQGDRSLARNAM